jgi:hypothetical protein
MTDNYQQLANSNVAEAFHSPPTDLARRLGGQQTDSGITLKAFGRRWVLTPTAVMAENDQGSSVEALLVSLYARHNNSAPMQREPFVAFKELPDSAPYAGAFARHAQLSLAPFVPLMDQRRDDLCALMDGALAKNPPAGDLAFTLHPLPKIALHYICYHADEDFPAAVTCLYSHNASIFMPTDALADVGEYTAKAIIAMFG